MTWPTDGGDTVISGERTTVAAAHAVMICGNDVVSDARVLKYAATAARFGLRVTALGVSRNARRGELSLDKVKVVQVPVQPRRRGPLARLASSTVSHFGRLQGSGTPQVHADGDGERVWRHTFFRRIPAAARWRRVLPEIVDQERALGPVLDNLEPDLVHVHDVFMLGTAAEHVRRMTRAGRRVCLVYDAHEYLAGLATLPTRRVAAYCDLEREFLPAADSVVTVSPHIAAALQRDYGLERLPIVVLNAPVADDPDVSVTPVREVVGVPQDVPLLVYGGGLVYARGVHTVVEALRELNGVHLVVVVNRPSTATVFLEDVARRHGVRERLHFAPFVAPELVPRYIASASVGVSPLLHSPNHDMAITNKFCEYVAAGIPIVTSDTPAQAELVDGLDLGAVHRAGDVRDCAQAIRLVLNDLGRLSARIRSDDDLRHRFSWEAQAAVVRDLYAALLGALPPQAWMPDSTKVRRLLVHD